MNKQPSDWLAYGKCTWLMGVSFGWGWSVTKKTVFTNFQLKRRSVGGTCFAKYHTGHKYESWSWLKIMNGLSWHLVEDGYLGIGKHRRKWIAFVHAKVVLPSQSVFLNRIGKWIFLNYLWTRQGRFCTYSMKIWPKEFMRFFWEFWEWQKYRLLHNLGQKLPHGHDT